MYSNVSGFLFFSKGASALEKRSPVKLHILRAYISCWIIFSSVHIPWKYSGRLQCLDLDASLNVQLVFNRFVILPFVHSVYTKRILSQGTRKYAVSSIEIGMDIMKVWNEMSHKGITLQRGQMHTCQKCTSISWVFCMSHCHTRCHLFVITCN